MCFATPRIPAPPPLWLESDDRQMRMQQEYLRHQQYLEKINKSSESVDLKSPPEIDDLTFDLKVEKSIREGLDQLRDKYDQK